MSFLQTFMFKYAVAAFCFATVEILSEQEVWRA